MSNHLPPQLIAEQFDLDEDDVLRFCDEQSIPVLHGRIDKSLFAACLAATSKERGGG